MRRTAGLIGKALFLLLVAVLLLAAVLPAFIDRVYYRGPVSAHFDGERFFNPGEGAVGGVREGFSPARMLRFLLRTDRATWPEQVPVRQAKPVARVDGADMRVTWVGHASVLLQTQGLNILTDPIWSDVASPLPPIGPHRVRRPGVAFDDLPRIDVVIVSHNHYDHMDLPTLKRLWARDRPVIVTSLGNDAILRSAGIGAVARDWGGRVAVQPGVDIVVERVQHWGSRTGSDRNRALWSGFTVTLPGGNLFFAGDTGFGDGRWPGEAAARGPIRLAILPIGAYLPRAMMRSNHSDPGEAVTIFERLGAAHALAMHWGTFQLSDEAIDAPRADLARSLAARGIAAERFRATEAGVAWDVPAL